ncbi:MAG TPA: alpha/beta fold hydrolase [Acidimicrobiia bacterium]|nr:alpha/beta fold hydrolase [Acidimicrobiia bacterium]
MATNVEFRHIEIHGHDLAYRIGGEGPVVLLVHGMAGSSATWRRVMPTLAERFTVIAPDLVGHGQSEKPRGDYSLGAFATGLRDLLLALGHERATLVGQSLGGGVAMQFAYQYPERCERLVLVSSGGLGDDVNLLLRLLALPGAELVLPVACTKWLYGVGRTTATWLRKVGLHTSPHIDEVWTAYGSLTDGETRASFLSTLRSVVDVGGQRVSASDRLYLASEVPTLIVWGDRDRIIPVEQGRETHEAIPGSRLEIFPGAGHFPHCEDPARFCNVLSDFIATTAACTTSLDEWRQRLRAVST